MTLAEQDRGFCSGAVTALWHQAAPGFEHPAISTGMTRGASGWASVTAPTCSSVHGWILAPSPARGLLTTGDLAGFALI